MMSEARRDVPAFRVTFFFGPEPVEGKADAVVCVFNVKKRSWKAGIQVAVEISTSQVTALRRTMELNDRLAASLKAVDRQEVSHYQERVEDVFVQALCRCKLDVRLQAGLAQENQRMEVHELTDELNHEAHARTDDILVHILDELDLISSHPSSL
ncbi:MAG: hypothetical protein OEV99_11635 [Nitrospira sp.]|nr:hypothetical protein [Nitrospira sp.]MDH4370483.1 hypothetical protein [Nitrospira sp.]MDH5496922.1 hypothetical protein [Nitrospira sp.]MDH5724381.1 hypothetical protein [Nitrospira sp.]